MTPPLRRALSFDEFVSYITKELDLNPGAVERATALGVEGLGLDSLGMYELLLIIEEFGCEVSESHLIGWGTIGEVFDFVFGPGSPTVVSDGT